MEQRRVGGTLGSTGYLSAIQEKKVRFTPDKTSLKLRNDYHSSYPRLEAYF